MSIKPITQPEFAKIRELLNTNTGIILNEDQTYVVETRLSSLGYEMGVATFGELFDKIRANPKQILPKVIHLLANHETCWFRDHSLWNTLEKLIFPQLFERLKIGKHKIRIWSAGCSSGQEPYSVAILIDELCQQQTIPACIERFSILATDMSDEILSIAKVAQYNAFDIKRGLSKHRRNTYFTQQQNNWQLNEEIRQRVEFRQINLIEYFTNPINHFDIILCRNVIVYFSTEFQQRVIPKLIKVLANNGVFFLGASESFQGYCAELKTNEFEEGVYYRL